MPNPVEKNKAVSNLQKLNPEIKVVQVGVREIKPVHIYPLSMKDHMDLFDMLGKTILTLGESYDFQNLGDEESIGVAVKFIQEIIMENLVKILEFVTDESERPTLDELTNNQFMEIANNVFEVNYEGFVKNLKNLTQKIRGMMPETKFPAKIKNQR
jgi:hypothetical protein